MAKTKNGEKSEENEFKAFIDCVVNALFEASNAKTKSEYLAAFDRTVKTTKDFLESLGIGPDEADNVEMVRLLKGLRSLADQDLESAKIQTRFAAEDLQNLKRELLGEEKDTLDKEKRQ